MERMEKPLGNEWLANGVEVRFFDVSRMVAGDRWQVTVRYDVVVTVPESFWSRVSGEAAMITEVRAALGREIVLSRTSERNFVSVEEKEDMVGEIVSRIRENMFAYLGDPLFAERYFQRRFKETCEDIELKKNVQGLPVAKECEEPVDFSHIFRDA